MRRGTTRFGVVARTLTAALLLAGMLAAAAPAGAQADLGLVSDTEYESPQFDFSMEWDAPWEIDDTALDSQAGRLDTIKLSSDAGFLQIILLFPTDEAEVYLDVLVQGAIEDTLESEELGRDSGSGYISSTVAFTLDTSSGPLDAIEYIEVGEIEARDGGDPGLFTATLLTPATEFEAQWESLNETVVRDGRDTLFLGTPEGIAGGSTTRGQEEEPTEEPTDEPNDNPFGSSGGIEDNTYTGPITGLYVEWDDLVWGAEDIGDDDGDGVQLEGDASRIQIVTAELPGGDVRTCVTDAADTIKSDEGVSGFRRATQIEPPELQRGAFGRLYSYDVETATGSDSLLHYIECRPVEDDTYLLIVFVTTPDAYDDEVAALADVTGTIEFGASGTGREEPEDEPTEEPTDEPTEESGTTGLGRNPGGDDDPTEEPTDGPSGNGLDGDTYGGIDFAFSVSWDEDLWTPEELEAEAGYEGVKLETDGATVYIEAIEGFGGDPETCVTTTGEGRADIDGVSDVRVSTRLDAPATDRDAEGDVYTYTYESSDGGTLDFAEYIECRPLEEDGSVLRVTVLTPADNYEDLIPAIEDLLAEIEVGGGSSSSGTNTNTTNSGGTDEEFPGVDGSSYESPQFGYTVSWSRDWEVLSSTDEPEGTSLLLGNGISTAFFFGGDFARDPETCVTQIAEVVESGNGVSNFDIVTNEDGEPQSGADRTSGYGFYSLTRGGDDYFSYIYCQPASDDSYVVVVVYEMPVSDIATELVALDELLGELEID